MRINFLIIALLLITNTYNCQAQFTLDLSRGMHFHLQESIEYEDGVEIDIMMPSQFAHNYVTNLVKMTGMPMTFKLVQSNSEFLDKAIAHVDGDESYLIYNEDFIKKIKGESYNDWSALFVLVHEIGHLLIRHPYSEDHKVKREYELQADHFAGFWLNKLGATAEEAIQYVKNLDKDPIGFHPSRISRIKAVTEGWNFSNQNVTRIIDDSLRNCNSSFGYVTFVNELSNKVSISVVSKRTMKHTDFYLAPNESKTVRLNSRDNEFKYLARSDEIVGLGMNAKYVTYNGVLSIIPCKTQIEILK